MRSATAPRTERRPTHRLSSCARSSGCSCRKPSGRATAATRRPPNPPLGESFLRVHWVAVPKALRARRPNRVTSLYPEPGQTSNADTFKRYKFVLSMENSNIPGCAWAPPSRLTITERALIHTLMAMMMMASTPQPVRPTHAMWCGVMICA
jgi:hypothetical protein